ncbi:MAG: hypothetical protein H0U85_01015 [Gemmatimonadales bacterium]|nr:hypothetical protein [Gemmatimonadales bacterium]
MKRTVTVLAALAVIIGTPLARAEAQGVGFGLGGTGVFNLGSGSYSALGAIGLVEFGGNARSPIHFRVDGTIAHGDGATFELVTADVVYAPHTPTSELHPYGVLGGGIQHGAGNTSPMAKAGVGFDYHLFKRNHGTVLFGEGTFNLVFAGNGNGTDKQLQLNLGLKFGAS